MSDNTVEGLSPQSVILGAIDMLTESAKHHRARKDPGHASACDIVAGQLRAALESLASQSSTPGADGVAEPRTAAQTLTERGVFKGADGLQRLAECQAFWDKQPYGTRLYFEDSGDGYLHRGVLRTAVEVLATTSPAFPAPVAGVTPYKPAGRASENWNSPMHDLQTRLEICAGAVEFRDKSIANLRAQIATSPSTPGVDAAKPLRWPTNNELKQGFKTGISFSDTGVEFVRTSIRVYCEVNALPLPGAAGGGTAKGGA